MLLLHIDKSKPEAIFSQLVKQIIQLIDNGNILEHYQMPSTRELAEKLGVNRSTIVRAYEELWALGYLESEMGSYTRVRKRKIIAKIDKTETVGSLDVMPLYKAYADFGNEKIERFTKLITIEKKEIINFQRLEPDIRLINRKTINACYRDVLNNEDINAFGYCHTRGIQPLRTSIVNHMHLHTINAKDENILITNGSQHSLHLIFQAYLRKNDAIIIEAPTYSMLLPLIRYFEVKAFEVPVNNDGLDIDAVKKIIRKNNIRLIFTMPTFQNPTGITMSQKKREALLHLCEQQHIIIVEDSIEEELKFFGKVHLPIKSMDTKGIVIYLGSFSKIISAGLRIGWIIANKVCIEQLTAIKTIFDISTNTLSQAMLERFCNNGHYELHIRKIMREFRKRMKTALKALKTYMPPDKVSWNEPLGGFLIWLKLKIKNPDIDLEKYFISHGVSISDGRAFFLSPQPYACIRISISRCNEAEITEGIRRIAVGLEKLE